MTATHWIRIAAAASVLALAGTAIAQDTDRAPRADDRSSVSPKEPPSAGAIVTPEDKALGFGKGGARPQDGDAAVTPDDEMSIRPGPSNDDMSVIPGTTNDDMIVTPDDAGMNRSRPSVRPGDMGPANVRGQ